MKNRIHEVAKLKNIKVSSIVKETGISKSFLYDVINNKCNPSISTARKIARVLDTSIDELFLDE